MGEGEMSQEMRDYFRQTIEAYRTSGAFKAAADLASSLDVELPGGVEQIAISPDAAMDWARRTIGIERKFKQEAGGDLDAIAEEKLKDIKLDPGDVQVARLSFVQLYSRFMFEATEAMRPDATPEKISLLRGGGQPFERWMAERVFREPEGVDGLDKALRHLDTLNAASLIAQPLEGVKRSGSLLVFAGKVEKARSMGNQDKQ